MRILSEKVFESYKRAVQEENKGSQILLDQRTKRRQMTKAVTPGKYILQGQNL